MLAGLTFRRDTRGVGHINRRRSDAERVEVHRHFATFEQRHSGSMSKELNVFVASTGDDNHHSFTLANVKYGTVVRAFDTGSTVYILGDRRSA